MLVATSFQNGQRHVISFGARFIGVDGLLQFVDQTVDDHKGNIGEQRLLRYKSGIVIDGQDNRLLILVVFKGDRGAELVFCLFGK